MIENAAPSRVEPVTHDHPDIRLPVTRSLRTVVTRGCSFIGVALLWLVTMVLALPVQAQSSALWLGSPTPINPSGNNDWVGLTIVSGDTTPPTVTSQSPSRRATGVGLGTTVTVVFSEPMNAATVNKKTVKLRDSTNVLVAASVTYSAVSRTATLTPNTPLAPSTTYTAIVKGGVRGVTDLAGNALAPRVKWSFTTSNQVDSPIATENALPGNPQSEWDVNGSGDSSILGFATKMSVNRGGTVRFKIDTDASNYRIDIYRMGYYGGDGARKVATVFPSAVLPQNQPNCLFEPSTGLTDCGNWVVSATWRVPANATSGIYLAKAVRNDTGGASHIVFVVRDDANSSDILFQTSDTTWQAYNDYGGNSLYVGLPAGRAYKASYNRPMLWRSGSSFGGVSNLFNAEYPMVRWLEANGYDVSYFTGIDSDRRGALIKKHKIFLSVGHDEYWSGQQRVKVERALAAGVNLAFFSGNEVFWKTRWENSIDGRNTPYRTLVCYKETHANQPIDPLDPPIWTGTWRDPRFSPPADGGRPENALTGQIFTVNGIQFNNLTVGPAYGRMRFWRDTGLENMSDFDPPETVGSSLLGFEWDEDLDNGHRPRGVVRLSSTTAAVNGRILDYGSSYAPGNATHTLTLYRHESGALVFGAGTIQWSWGLDGSHDNNAGARDDGPDVRVQQATVNLFADMGVQPQTLQVGLLAAIASNDTQPPKTTITSPAAGGTVELGKAIRVAGTATDVGGGVIGGVEVSVDNGGTWHPAAGREDWSYQWIPNSLGTVRIRAAAVDDSANLQSPGASVTVEVVPVEPGSGPIRLWSDNVTPTNPSANDPNPVELGVKFAADVSGSITGIRFYKGIGNTGAHFGHLWKGDGTLLATTTFENETASGWQYAAFPSPVPINANTTYVASYHTDVGGYAFDANYFAAAGSDNPPLHALRDGVDGGNGVYAYGGGGFPTFPSNTNRAANYWVDIDFDPSIFDPDPDPTPGPTSIWPSTVVPGIASANDPNAIELGVKFRTDTDGIVTALRFYKGSANTGTHLGNLWAADGTLLASATFANETPSGWQQVELNPPVQVVAGATYIASYHTDVGGYAVDPNYFAAAGVDSPPLYALRNGVDGGNGVFRYGPSGFPTDTYNSSNYWVDLVFEQNVPEALALTASGLTADPVSALAAPSAKDKVKKDYKPRKKSVVKYSRSAWRTNEGEGWSPLEPGARGPLNRGRKITKEGK